MATTTFATTTSETTGFALPTDAGYWHFAVATGSAVGCEGHAVVAGHGYAPVARAMKQAQARVSAVSSMPSHMSDLTSKPADAARLVYTRIDGDPRTWSPPV